MCQTRREEKGRGEEEKEEEEEEDEHDMVSIISFLKANLQHSSAASRILTRTVSIKGIEMVLIEEPLYCKDHIRGLNIPRYTLYLQGKHIDLGLVSLRGT